MSRLQKPGAQGSFETRGNVSRGAQDRAKALMHAWLAKRKLDAAQVWNAQIGAWVLPLKQAPLIIGLEQVEFETEDESAGGKIVKKTHLEDRLHIHAPIMRLPSSNLLALYRYVLEINSTLSGVAFAVRGEHLVLCGQRSLQDLDESELGDLIDYAASAASALAPVLLQEFDTGAVPM